MDVNEREERRGDFMQMFASVKGHWRILKVYFNPVVAISTFILVLSVVLWIIEDDNSEEYANDAQNWITKSFTWLYVSSTMAWVLFLFVVYFKFGHIKLGTEEEKPEHENFAYYAMLMTCGISSPVFYSGVSDTLRHYKDEDATTDFYSRDTTAAKAQHAISVTVYFWGLHGFAAYAVFGLIIGILTHRKGLPLTLRTCFYPLLGRLIFGRVGDIVDTLCISSILYGVSVSLVIGAKFLNSGFEIWNSNIDMDKDNQLCIIWGLTILSTLSVISGLNRGIKKLSQLCIIIGSLLCLFLLTAHETAHILNVIVQSIGYYAQFLVGFGLYTAAFEQRGLADENLMGDSGSKWINSNTIFFWGWWISWAPFVGLFIAKVSRGRTVRDVIHYSFFLPVITLFIWLVTFGTIGLDMEMDANNHNITCVLNDGRNEYLEALRNKMPWKYDRMELLTCYHTFSQTFMMFNGFEDITQILRAFCIIGAILFFVTSSDSASLVVDCVASNGKKNPPVIQRVFWALCEGLVASALLQHTKDKESSGLEAFVILSGFPLVFLLSFCCYSLWSVLKKEPNWRIELERVWENPSPVQYSQSFLKLLAEALFTPWYIMGKVSMQIRSESSTFQMIQGFLIPALMFNLWIIFLFMRIEFQNLDNIGWSFLVLFICYGANLREKVRSKYEIEGNYVTDVTMMVFYPFTVLQMKKQIAKPVNRESQRRLHIEQFDVVTDEARQHTASNGTTKRSLHNQTESYVYQPREIENGYAVRSQVNKSYDVSC